MKYSDIAKDVAKELNIPEKIVYKTYKAYWKVIKNRISELPLKEELTEEQFDSIKTNFNIPSLGKLHCTYPRYLAIKKRLIYINKLRKEEQNVEDKED